MGVCSQVRAIEQIRSKSSHNENYNTDNFAFKAQKVKMISHKYLLINMQYVSTPCFLAPLILHHLLVLNIGYSLSCSYLNDMRLYAHDNARASVQRIFTHKPSSIIDSLKLNRYCLDRYKGRICCFFERLIRRTSESTKSL